MSILNGEVARWLAGHYGAIDRPTLRTFGVSNRQIDGLLASGELLVMHRGVYRAASTPMSFEQQAVAACLALRSGGVSRTAAGRIWGLRKMGRTGVQMLIPHSSKAALGGVSVHRCRDVVASDWVVRDDGIRLTSPPRTAFDLAAVLDDHALESVLEQIIDRYCSYGVLQKHLDRLWKPHRPGALRLARVLGSRPAHARAADSDPEVVLSRALRQAGCPCEPQYRIELANGVVIHPDLARSVERVAIEVDHATWHGGALQVRRDHERDRWLALEGWQSLRVTDVDVDQRLVAVVDEIVAVVQTRKGPP